MPDITTALVRLDDIKLAAKKVKEAAASSDKPLSHLTLMNILARSLGLGEDFSGAVSRAKRGDLRSSHIPAGGSKAQEASATDKSDAAAFIRTLTMPEDFIGTWHKVTEWCAENDETVEAQTAWGEVKSRMLWELENRHSTASVNPEPAEGVAYTVSGIMWDIDYDHNGPLPTYLEILVPHDCEDAEDYISDHMQKAYGYSHQGFQLHRKFDSRSKIDNGTPNAPTPRKNTR